MTFKKGFFFVVVQFALLALIFLTGPNIPRSLYLQVLFALGVLVGAVGVWNMRVSKLRTEPEVADDSKLVTTGIYKYIRHPMYLGLILLSLALILDYFTYLRLLFLILLIINQYLKLSYEESLLEKHFKEYKDYEKRSKRLIPFIF